MTESSQVLHSQTTLAIWECIRKHSTPACCPKTHRALMNAIYRGKLCDAWWKRTGAGKNVRILLSHSPTFAGKGQRVAPTSSWWTIGVECVALRISQRCRSDDSDILTLLFLDQAVKQATLPPSSLSRRLRLRAHFDSPTVSKRLAGRGRHNSSSFKR